MKANNNYWVTQSVAMLTMHEKYCYYYHDDDDVISDVNEIKIVIMWGSCVCEKAGIWLGKFMLAWLHWNYTEE